MEALVSVNKNGSVIMMGKRGDRILFFLESQRNRWGFSRGYTGRENGSDNKRVERFYLFNILHQPGVRSFHSGVKPEHGIDIKMYQPRGTFSLLAYLFLIAVFYCR